MTSLFAGTASPNRLTYSSESYATVKTVSQRSRSAGNFSDEGSSETTRDEIVENVRALSDHVPTHRKPATDEEFGHYLAGLIDGDGHICVQQRVNICFHEDDAPLAYYVKSRVGFGSVRKVKNKRALTLTIAARLGVERVMRLVNGKLRAEHRYDQAVNRIINHTKFAGLKKEGAFTKNSSSDLENH